MYKILVTGGAGFIGSHITDKLVAQGHEVIVLDNLSSGIKGQVNQRAKFIEMDIRDEKLLDLFKEESPEIIFHLAAQMSVPFSVENPRNDLDVNGMGILNLLEACRKTGVKKIIMSSTGGAIYGDASKIPTPEDELPKPLAPYGITKLLSENYLYFYKETFGLDYTVLRYSNVYGPRQLNAHESGVITIFIRQVLAGKSLKIYAYPDEQDGMTRDYIFVADVVAANLAAMKSKSGIYNIGTSVSTNTRQLYDMISELTNIKVDVLVHPQREGDIRSNTLDNSLAKQTLDWSPKHDLKSGMQQTIDYFKNL